MLENLILQADSPKIDISNIGYKEIHIISGYEYLSNQHFLTGFQKGLIIGEALSNAKCSPRGMKLIAAHEESKMKKIKVTKEIGINGGKLHAMYKTEIEK